MQASGNAFNGGVLRERGARLFFPLRYLCCPDARLVVTRLGLAAASTYRGPQAIGYASEAGYLTACFAGPLAAKNHYHPPDFE